MIETYRGVVRPSELDHMDHMNVQFYTAKFDEATWHFFSAVGLTNTYFQAENKGMAAVLQTTNYKAEAIAGDLLICRSQMLEVKDKTIRFIHHMLNCETDAVLATTELIAAHLDRSIRKACAFPEGIRTKCNEFIVE